MIRYLSILFVVLLACGKGQQKCKFNSIRRLYSIVQSVGKESSYLHLVIVNDFSKNCIDSSMMVNLALRYLDTVKADLPVSCIRFYSTDKGFIPSETSQLWNEVDRNILVSIDFDKRMNPCWFVFYGEDGEYLYSGEKWMKKSK